MMKRVFAAVALLTTATLIACEDTPTEPELGGISFQIYMVGATAGSAPAAASGPSLSSHTTPLDSGQIVLTGPTNMTVSATPGTAVTISDLTVGTYAAELLGYVADQVTFRGTVTDIAVAEGGTNAVAEVLFIPTDLEFGAINETIQLTGFPTGTNWVSAAPTIVSVDAAGLLTALANGNADITGSIGTTTAASAAEVHQNVASVTVDPPTPSIAGGATQQFTATALDSGGSAVTGASVLWISADPFVATIDQTGLATGRGAGTVDITAAIDGEVGSTTLTVTGTSGTQPSRIAFTTEPSGQSGFDPVPAFEVSILDENGNVLTGATNAVELRVRGDPFSGLPDGPVLRPPALFGTTTVAAVGGVATFTDIRIDRPGDGYSLEAAIGLPAPVGSPAGVPGSQVTAVSQDFNARVTATQVVATSRHACMLASTGHGYCFGDNGNFEAGPRLIEADESIPATRALAPTFVQLAAGQDHSCGLTGAGAVWCWGANSDGQLGQGTINDNEDYLDAVEVTGGNTFTQISAGRNHTCGVAGTDIFCWGYGFTGELGHGAYEENGTPQQVSGTEVWASVDAGMFHTCAINTAGRAFCWGEEFAGRLGYSATPASNPNTPQALSNSIVFTQISAGHSHTCGRTSSALYCWGEGSDLRLGTGTTTDQFLPVAITAIPGSVVNSVSAGDQHTCAVVATPLGVFCWGDSFYGQVGSGAIPASPYDIGSPTQIAGGGADVIQLEVADLTSCAVTATGEVLCWGYNGEGMLGIGQQLPAANATPVQVFGTGPSS